MFDIRSKYINCVNCKHFKKYKTKNFIGRCKKNGNRIQDVLDGCLEFKQEEIN